MCVYIFHLPINVSFLKAFSLVDKFVDAFNSVDLKLIKFLAC